MFTPLVYNKRFKKYYFGTTGQEATVSAYSPSEDTKKVTQMVQNDMSQGRLILTTARPEFGGRSIIEERNYNQRRFNANPEAGSNDPDESWRSDVVRPIARNKTIAIAAHITQSLLVPKFVAQNSRDEEDRLAAQVMDDIESWVVANSQYSRTFIQAVLASLIDPLAIVETGYAKVLRKVRDVIKDKNSTRQEIRDAVDEALSGFVFNFVPVNEIYISNYYEQDIRRQRFVARRKLIDYSEAVQKYGDHPDFKFVQPGIRNIFNVPTNSYYTSQDNDLNGNLVEEVCYYNRYLDLKLVYCSGILVSTSDNPIPRQDKDYPYATLGFEMINNGQCFFYKSLVSKLKHEQDIVDVMYRMVLDGTMLQLMPPMALYGQEDVTSNVMIPGMITSFRDPNTKMESIAPRNSLQDGINAITLIERSMAESSQDNFRQGQLVPGERTAVEFSEINANAKTMLGLYSHNLIAFVERLGNLNASDILQYMTVAEVDKITDDEIVTKYKTILLPDSVVDGKKMTRKISFTDKYTGKESVTYDEIRKKSMDVLEQEGLDNDNGQILYVNAIPFRELKFLARCTADALQRSNKALEKALTLEKYDRLIQQPDVDPKVLISEIAELYEPGSSSRIFRKDAPQQQANAGQGPSNSGLTAQMTGSNSVRDLMAQQ